MCHKCEHKFRISTPKEILPRYYEKQYWDNDKNRQGISSVKPSDEWTKWVAARLKILKTFQLLHYPEPNKVHVLEFGCAEGMLLYALKQRGYQVVGNDICAITSESERELGINISNLPVEEFCHVWGGYFDLIMSFHVVEHLRDPQAVMKQLASLLKKGGKMLLHVPIDDQELNNADHFHFFSHKSCMNLMEQFTTNIRTDFVYYPIRAGGVPMAGKAMAATYVGDKI